MDQETQIKKLNALAVNLFGHVYDRISAIVSFDDAGKIIEIKLFDTDFCDSVFPTPCAKEVWLMSNHPEGSEEPYARDIENAERIRKTLPDVRMRVFLTNEDFICREAVW